jgi:hypothetical protein
MSNQIQNLTTSLDGTKRVAKLQAHSYFYLEGNSFTQQQSQAFGALSSSNEFQTTATVSFGATKKVYALCQGTVFLQPQKGSTTKVNLVLKPYNQPIKGLNIKYIIYRGLDKSDFIDNGGKVFGDATTGSEFVQYIWQQFNRFYDVANGGTAPQFNAEFIGFPTTPQLLAEQTDESLIDQYFFKISTYDGAGEEEAATAYELPLVPKGIQLGNAAGSLGIDIVLNDGDYLANDNHPFQLNLGFAREVSHTLDLSTQTDDFQKKLLKDAATNFVDIAAFYGLHANGGSKIGVNFQTDALTEKADIYSLLSNFHTKNNYYIYLRSNRQRYYNFYGNYQHSDANTNDFQIGADATALTEMNFGISGWSIHVIDQTQDPANEDNTIVLQLTTDNHSEAGLFAQIGVIASEHEENFVRQTNLLQDAADDNIDANYTKPITLLTPAVNGENIAAFTQLVYEGKMVVAEEYIAPGGTATPATYFLKDIDDIFGLVNATGLLTSEMSDLLPTIVDEQLQLVTFTNSEKGQDIGAVKCQKVADTIKKDDGTLLNRLTYETLLHTMKRVASPYLKNTEVSSDSATTSVKGYTNDNIGFYQPKSPYNLQTKFYTDGLTTITGLYLATDSDNIPTKKILGLTNTEHQRLHDLITNNNLTNAKIYFQSQIGGDDWFVSIEDTYYKIYTLGIIGEDAQGDLKVFFPTQTVQVYSTDLFVFYSNEYSKFIPKLNEIIDIDFKTRQPL